MQCLIDGDCSGPADVCEDGACVVHCTSDDHCPGQRCQLDTGDCVDCLDKADCGPGYLCEDNLCVEGCEEDAECIENPSYACQYDGLFSLVCLPP